jgi:hypothetical protein
MLRSRKWSVRAVKILAIALALVIGILVPLVLAKGPSGPVLQGEDELPMLEDMIIGGIPVILLIVLIVQIFKDWVGVPGQYLRWISLGLGLAFGILYQYGMGWPEEPWGWVVFVVRLLFGVLSSSLVDFTRDVASRVGLNRR